MTTQRKEDLLKQLDLALNRKVQQKYHNNNAKTQQIPNHPTSQYNIDKYKKQTVVDSKHYKTKDHFVKSPIVGKKSVQKDINGGRNIKLNDPEHHYYANKGSEKNISGSERMKLSHVVSPVNSKEH